MQRGKKEEERRPADPANYRPIPNLSRTSKVYSADATSVQFCELLLAILMRIPHRPPTPRKRCFSSGLTTSLQRCRWPYSASQLSSAWTCLQRLIRSLPATSCCYTVSKPNSVLVHVSVWPSTVPKSRPLFVGSVRLMLRCSLPQGPVLDPLLFTAPHWMQGGLVARKVSVRSSVKRLDCDNAEKIVQIFIPYERPFSLVYRRMVGGSDPFYLKFWVNRPPLE